MSVASKSSDADVELALERGRHHPFAAEAAGLGLDLRHDPVVIDEMLVRHDTVRGDGDSLATSISIGTCV